jgi:hypothetical protein
MAYWLGKRLAEMDERLRRVDERVSRLEKAFTQFSDLLALLLSGKGLLTQSELLLLRGVTRALLPSPSSKYYTREVYEKLKQLLEKNPEDYTMADVEELFKAAELVEKEGFESGREDLKDYAWRLRFYAMLVRAVYIYPKIARAYSEKPA